MSYVKNYDVGQIKLDMLNSSNLADAPYMQYTHELPLLSFGDIQNTVGLSLVFNYERYRNEKKNNTNPFFIAPGFKLNLQKGLTYSQLGIFTNYLEGNGTPVDLDNLGGMYYIFNDDSKRIMRKKERLTNTNSNSGGNIEFDGDSPVYDYFVEYPDFSKEKYSENGQILAVYNKYSDNAVLSYAYDAEGHLIEIQSGEDKTITFIYNLNQLSSITYNGKSISFSYNSNGTLNYIEHYTGVRYVFSLSMPYVPVWDGLCELQESDFKIEATSLENDTVVSYSKELKLCEDGKTVEIIDNIGDNTVNKVSYRHPKDLLQHIPPFGYVDITDNNGVITRAQIEDHKISCSYELKDSDKQFCLDKFAGTVTLYNTSESSQNNNAIGMQTYHDGMQMYYNSSAKEWSRTHADENENGGYYTLSGWIKTNDQDVYSDKIHIITPNNIYEFEINMETVEEWTYFSYLFYASSCNIYVYNSANLNVTMRDLRLIFERPDVFTERNTSNITITDYVLLNGNNEIPFKDAQFRYALGSSGVALQGVTIADIMRCKLRHKKEGVFDEVYYNNCRNIICGANDLEVLHNDNYVSISNFDLGIKTHSRGKSTLTRICVDETNQNSNITKTNTVDGSIISTEILNQNLDVISSTIDGITTQYTRDASGRVTEETVPGLYKYVTTYTDALITVEDVNPSTGETMNSVKYHIDTAWGVINKVELLNSSGAAQSLTINTYDDAKNTVISKAFDNMYISKNAFEYKHGRLASIGNGAIDYDFAYNDTVGKLESISKNGASIEHHAYEKNNGELTTESSYASSENALHTESITFDKYGRLKSINGILENAYDLNPYWYFWDANANYHTDIEEYDRSQHGELTQSTKDSNGRDALLAQTTDKLTNEVIRYGYDNGKITAAVTRDLTEFPLKQEIFVYDDKERLTKDRFDYDLAGNGYVTSEITYERTDTDPLADHRVNTYTYKVNNVKKAETINLYDSQKRITRKSYTITSRAISKDFHYTGKRITSTNEIVGGTTNYEYDDIGRIISISNIYNGTNITYKYNNSGQLIRENNMALDKTFVYQYNNGGISKIKEYAYTTGSVSGATAVTTSFAYDSTCIDRLKSCGSTSITYNSIGCPTAYNGYAATWTRGKLSKLTKGLALTGTHTYDYTHNAFGRRIGSNYTFKPGTASGSAVAMGTLMGYVKIFRYDQSGRLIQESKTSQYYGEGSATETIVYLYDEREIIGMVYTNASGVSNTYYFQRNLLGDVIGIYNASGNRVGGYVYDAWGNCTITLNTGNIATINPIRYRGYYYDEESGLYYLNARYYSPTWRRFISPDDTAYLDPDSFNGLNQYCYCNNDPVNYVDPSGNSPEWWQWLLVGVGAALVVGAVTVLTCGIGTSIMVGTLAGAMLHGAAIGTLIGAGAGAVAGGIIGGVVSDWSVEGVVDGIMIGFGGGAIVGAIIGATVGGVHYGWQQSVLRKASSFSSYPDEATELHHIVEQCQIKKSGFSSKLIRNSNNEVRIAKSLHTKVSSYYSSLYKNTGMRFRNYLAANHYSLGSQYNTGIKVLNMMLKGMI